MITPFDIFICQALLRYMSCTQQIMLSCATASAFVLCFFLALDVYEFCYAIGYDSSVLITSNIQLFGNDKPHVIIMQQQVHNDDLFIAY